ncbi:hypothetical protein BH09BAC3_BH09BAC3_21600 [soil metagenome]
MKNSTKSVTLHVSRARELTIMLLATGLIKLALSYLG